MIHLRNRKLWDWNQNPQCFLYQRQNSSAPNKFFQQKRPQDMTIIPANLWRFHEKVAKEAVREQLRFAERATQRPRTPDSTSNTISSKDAANTATSLTYLESTLTEVDSLLTAKFLQYKGTRRGSASCVWGREGGGGGRWGGAGGEVERGDGEVERGEVGRGGNVEGGGEKEWGRERREEEGSREHYLPYNKLTTTDILLT